MFASVQTIVEEASRHHPVTVVAHLVRDRGPDLDHGAVGPVHYLVRVVLPHLDLDHLLYREDMDLLVFLIEEGSPGELLKMIA